MNNADLIDALNDLIDTCHDGQLGFVTGAGHVTSEPLRQLLAARADACRAAAVELQAQVRELGGVAHADDAAEEAPHRGWAAVRNALAGSPDGAILDDCERGEDLAAERYRSVLAENMPRKVRELVARQSEAAERNHTILRKLTSLERSHAV